MFKLLSKFKIGLRLLLSMQILTAWLYTQPTEEQINKFMSNLKDSAEHHNVTIAPDFDATVAASAYFDLQPPHRVLMLQSACNRATNGQITNHTIIHAKFLTQTLVQMWGNLGMSNSFAGNNILS